MRAQQQRSQRGEQCHFIVRKNPNYLRRRQLLPPIIETKSLVGHQLASVTPDPVQYDRFSRSITKVASDENSNYSRCANEQSQVCNHCRNNLRSCEFCNKNITKKLSTRLTRVPTTDNLVNTANDDLFTVSNKITTMTTYNPVYNIREIRTVSNSFSSLGIDKKLADLERNSHKTISLSSGGQLVSAHTMANNTNGIVQEAVNNNPAKGYGSYVYI